MACATEGFSLQVTANQIALSVQQSQIRESLLGYCRSQPVSNPAHSIEKLSDVADFKLHMGIIGGETT